MSVENGKIQHERQSVSELAYLSSTSTRASNTVVAICLGLVLQATV